MAISKETTIEAYQLRAGGTRARMAILRMIAADSVRNANPDTRLNPGDWRGARRYTMKSYEAAYCHGVNQSVDSWYSHGGEQFRNERDSHDILRMRHRGWFTDCDGRDSAIGIVAGLSHGRFIAGCRWTANDERVYYPEVYSKETEAARMADEHARVFAESAREDSERYARVLNAEIDCDDARRSAAGLWPARNASKYCRDKLREAIEALREARDELQTATAEYEGA